MSNADRLIRVVVDRANVAGDCDLGRTIDVDEPQISLLERSGLECKLLGEGFSNGFGNLPVGACKSLCTIDAEYSDGLATVKLIRSLANGRHLYGIQALCH